jgi:hypothetical protein
MNDASDKKIPQARQGIPEPPGKEKPRISIAEAKDALLRSGYILEHRVENFLRSRKWYVQTNTPYNDPETHKSRELDVYATNYLQIGESNGALMATIVGECVNNPQPLAFITKEERFSDLFGFDIKLDLGLDEESFNTESQSGLATFLGLNEFHHYCFGRVATQFCSFVPKDKGKPSDWIAKHEDAHFECFNTLIKAVEHQANTSEFFNSDWISANVIYPVLILQGDLLDVRLVGGDLTLEPVNYVKYKRSVIWEGNETGYVIDIVTEQGLSELLEVFERELERTVHVININASFLKPHLKKAQEKDLSQNTGKLS